MLSSEGQCCLPSVRILLLLLKVVESRPDFLARLESDIPLILASLSIAVHICSHFMFLSFVFR